MIKSLSGKLVISLFASQNFSLALTDTGELYSWGWNLVG
jgi:alpha-tubulin suppressor-like RCC1 family protein